jgi:hypothetical protein
MDIRFPQKDNGSHESEQANPGIPSSFTKKPPKFGIIRVILRSRIPNHQMFDLSRPEN